MAITLTIGGTNYLPFLKFDSLGVDSNQEIKGSILAFDLYIYGNPIDPPLAGREVILVDGSTREFGGSLVRVGSRLGESGKLIIYTLTCIDYTYYLDRRYLNKVYTAAAAGTMMKTAITDLKNAADNDSALGDAHYNDFDSDVSLISTGPSIRQQLIQRLLPSQFFDIIAESAGMIWFVDFNKRVNLIEFETNDAPLVLMNGRPVFDVEGETTQGWNWSEEESIEGTGTLIILQDTSIRSSATITDKFVWNTGNDTKFILSRRPFSELDITLVTLNSVTQTQKLEDVDRDASDDTSESGVVFIYVGGALSNSPSYVRFPTGDLSNGDPIEVTYNYITTDDHESADAVRLAELAERTGGDGIHQYAFSQVSGLAVQSPEDLDELSEILMDRKAKIHRRGAFTTWVKGWAPGQTFDRIWTKASEGTETMYVIAVSKSIVTPADDPNLSDNVIKTEVEYSNIPRGIQL